MKKVLIIVIVIAVLAVVSYFAYKSYKKKQESLEPRVDEEVRVLESGVVGTDFETTPVAKG